MSVSNLKEELDTMNFKLTQIANLVKNWQMEQIQRNGRMRKKFSDDEDDILSSDDEEQKQAQKFIGIMCKLPYYEPSQNMLKAISADFNDESLAVDNKTFSSYLQTQQLDSENVCSVLSTLLNIEDISNMQLYAQLMQPKVYLRKIGKLCYSFVVCSKADINIEDVVVPNVDEAVLIPKASLEEAPPSKNDILSLLPHKHESLPSKNPKRRFVANVEQVTRTSIQLKFKRGTLNGDLSLTEPYFVILRSRRTAFRFMYRAMQLLQESPCLRRYLFPTKPLPVVMPRVNLSSNIILFNDTIASNMEQLQAVHQIVNGPSKEGPYIVFGPPGTGKTTTIVEAILQLRLRQPRSRILVTAGSNSACDTIAVRICKYFASNERLQAHLMKRAKESRLVTEDVELKHQLIRLFSRSVYAKGLNSVEPLLLSHSNCAKHEYEHLRVNKLRKYGIIVATLCTVGRLVTDNVGKFNFFTHVFIDEAGASTEPEALVGIVGIKQQEECHVILSGDHKQLGAVIKNNRAANLGLRHSLMERLLRCEMYAVDGNGNYDHTLQTRLRQNYRSHPAIVGLFNKLYYNNELIAQAPPSQVNLAANWRMLSNSNFPILFQATHGVTRREDRSTSSLNMLEAQVVCWYVQRLLSFGLGGGVCIQQTDIGIVAPYAAQCKLLNELLRDQGYYDVEVGSVENYQGREKPIIIATLVRSFANIGFMRNPRRVNVLLSRAKSLMILIGNPVTLRHHRDINYVIHQCKLHGNYIFKKRNGEQRPRFLKDLVEDDDVVDDQCESDEEDNFWYAKMPQDIPVAFPKSPHGAKANENGNGNGTDDRSKRKSRNSGDSFATESLTESSSSSTSIQSSNSPNSISIGNLNSAMANLTLLSPEKITVHSNFLLACAAASEFTKQKLLQLQ
ncbi:PREDICTED: putative helicase MOV-10 [Drosophila arizonae]|uniref:Helicase MOV-10 n=1 Tax=Drosophila arizonae TaxID=7263 RepID=A0ABM1PKZ2_DROAR|nr:PREDICTED: putative helicase MOV-10 [Drosophila arizonae]